MKNKISRANGVSYVRFGKLKSFDAEGDRVTITNEDGDIRIKMKIYSSWTTTVDKLKDMIGQDIITCTSIATTASANYVFSDVFVNRNYFVNLYDEDGKKEKRVTSDLLQVPRVRCSERPEIQQTVRELIIQARIDTQREAYWARRTAKYQFGDVEEQNRILVEEQANLSKKDKDALARYEEEVRAAVPKWLKDDKMRSFRIVGDRGPDNNSLTHFDKEIAMRYRMDTTKLARIDVAVKEHISGNFILGDIVMPNGTGIMSLPQPCAIAVMKLHKENAWQVKTVRPLHKTKTWYRLERKAVGDNKDAKKPLDYWFGIYDEVMSQIDT